MTPSGGAMTLVAYAGDLQAQSRVWTSLHDAELRRRAVEAAGNKDVETLVSLTVAFLTQQGKSGVLTSPKTVAAYALGVRQFLAYAEVSALSLLRPGRHDGQGYVGHLLASGRAPAGVQVKVAAAGCLYRALRWAGATEADPFRDVRIPNDPTPGIVKRPPYSEDDVAAVLEHADPQGKFLMFLLIHAGLRISEALALEWPDFDEGAKRLHVRSGKGRKERLVSISASLSRATRTYRALYGPGGPNHGGGKRTTPPERVFRFGDAMTARHHLQKAFKAAGVPFRGFHPGRKYAGTRLLAQIRDFGRVAAHLGHASIDTTRKGYAQLPSDDLKDVFGGW